MSADKYPSIFSRQMKAIVHIVKLEQNPHYYARPPVAIDVRDLAQQDGLKVGHGVPGVVVCPSPTLKTSRCAKS